MEKWKIIENLFEKTKYCNMLESLNKNEKVKEFIVNTVTEKTDRDRTVESILKVLEENTQEQ